MIKKILCLIIVNGLFFSNSYLNCVTPTKSLDVKTAYCENNKWDFIKNELVNKVDYMSNDNFIIVWSIMTAVYGLGLIAAEKFAKKEKAIVYTMRTLFTFLSTIFVTCLLDRKKFMEKCKHENLFIVMDEFFKNYSIESDSKLKINYRRFVPKELLSSFDLIYDSYKKEGPKSLENFFDIFNAIRDKLSVN